jgi:hypothetical protein
MGVFRSEPIQNPYEETWQRTARAADLRETNDVALWMQDELGANWRSAHPNLKTGALKKVMREHLGRTV